MTTRSATRVQVPTAYYQFDQQGVAFNMWYLAYLEHARNEFFDRSGHSLARLVRGGHDIQVVHVDLAWTAGIVYGDALTIDVSVRRVGTTSLTLEYGLQVEEQVRAQGTSTYVIVDALTGRKHPIPDAFRSALSGPA